MEGFPEISGLRFVTFSRILLGFSGQVARGMLFALHYLKNRFTARGGARPPARPMHRANRLATPRPMVPHMPRRPPRPPRGGRHGKSPPRATCPKKGRCFSGNGSKNGKISGKTFGPKKSGPKFSRIFRVMAQSPGRFFRAFVKTRSFCEAPERPSGNQLGD